MDALVKAINTSQRFSFEGAVSALRNAMPIYEINDVERAKLNKFLERHDVKHAMKYGELALVFSRASGIGISVTASVKSHDGVIISENVTDYDSW